MCVDLPCQAVSRAAQGQLQKGHLCCPRKGLNRCLILCFLVANSNTKIQYCKHNKVDKKYVDLKDWQTAFVLCKLKCKTKTRAGIPRDTLFEGRKAGRLREETNVSPFLAELTGNGVKSFFAPLAPAQLREPLQYMAMHQSRIDLLKIAQVQDVQLEKGQDHLNGTLHLTVHNLIFNHAEGELWIPYPIIHTVERRPPSLQSSRHPLVIRCRDFVVVTLAMMKDGEAQDVFDSVQRLSCTSSPDQFYAYSFQPQTPFTSTDGWDLYDPKREYERMGVGSKTDKWRITSINKDYAYSPTYPGTLVVPKKISDNVLNYAAKYRSKARVPALSYLHWANLATITRSSQPLVGIKQARSIQDEKLIEAIFASNVETGQNGQTIYGSTAANMIIDARPVANAMTNVARGAGTENMENYRSCTKKYVAIENIHVMRDSLVKLNDAMQGTESGGQVIHSALQRSSWLKHISTLLEGTAEIVKRVHVYNSHVLVHCSDGWDRTTQLVSTSELCLDPFYRTFKGFQILIEKEWVSFGHKFSDRCGHLTSEKYFLNLTNTGGNAATNTIKDMQNKFYKSRSQQETSPVFHQFLDCIFQLLEQFPTRFEFNEAMLIDLHYHLYSCQFGTFLFNNESERTKHDAKNKTISAWDHFNSHRKKYTNKQYDPKKDEDLVDGGGVLFPDHDTVKYWSSLFHRQEHELNSSPVYEGSTAMESMGVANDDVPL